MKLTAPPKFSWSATRGNTFEDCRRAYFYQYYLANGRAEGADPDDVARAARLKRLSSLPLWVGSRVHDAIEGVLREARDGGAADIEVAVERMVGQMRADYRASTNGGTGKWKDFSSMLRFHEHEYAAETGRVLAPEDWTPRVESACAMLRAFPAHGYVERARTLGPARVRALEELEDWPLDDVKVYVKIDFAYEDDDGTVHIVDWKTGQREHGETPIQMLGYALFAMKRWNVPIERLRVKEVFLAKDDTDRPCTITADTLAAAEQRMRRSIEAMLEALHDPRRDVARAERFEPTPSWRCRSCNFLALCDEGRAASRDAGRGGGA